AVAHAHFGPTGYLFAPLCKASHVPMAVSFYGADASSRDYTTEVWRRRYRRLFRDAQAALVEGPALAARLVALGCPEDRVHVIRLPYVLGDGVAAEPAETPRYDVFLGGRLVPKKGFDIALRAFAAAFPRSDQRLVVVGDGSEDGRLR